jgi:Glycosyl hydrolase family 99
MKRLYYIGIGFLLVLCAGSCNKDKPDNGGEFTVKVYAPVDVPKTNSVPTWVHYMPWFETKETSENGQWGIHWTMSTRNPDNIDKDGKREIASWFYPLIGPYASKDPDVLEYHLLLMKYSGIDGLLIDWYGSSDLNDYKAIRTNTEALINALDEVGLDFAIVYEDRTITAAIKNDPGYDRIAGAQDDMLYLEQNYFSQPSYITINGKPLLLVFGPEEFHQPEEWSEILAVLSPDPCFVVLNGNSSQTSPSSSGEYIWVDNSSLDTKYSRMNAFGVFIGGAYPGFKDFYQEGGWGTGMGWEIAHNDGETFRTTLQKASTAGAEYLQLITWNDFGEGTMIEPTQEFEYTLLENVQHFTGVTYQKAELEKIYDLEVLRKEFSGQQEEQKRLDQAFYYFVSLQTDKAVHLIDSLKAVR